MLKKSLIALAIASASASTFAADIKTDTVTSLLSLEGNGLSTEIAPSAAVVVELEAEYTVGDIVTFTFAGGKFHKDAVIPASIVSQVVDNSVGASGGTEANKSIYGMTLGLLNSTETTAVYRVTELDNTVTGAEVQGFTTIGQKLNLAGLTFDASSFAGKITASYAAKTANDQDLDMSGSLITDYIVGKTQLEADVNAQFDAVIDVDVQRVKFENAELADQAKLVFTDNATGSWLNEADTGDVNVTLNGSFAFLDQDANTDGIQVAAGAIKITDLADISDSGTSDLTVTGLKVENEKLSFTLTDVSESYAAGGVFVTLTVPGDVAIPTQRFTADAVAEYSVGVKEGTSAILSSEGAGQWKLNGASVHVPFMPFRDGYSPIVNISNTSTQDGDIEVLVYAEDKAWVAPTSYTLNIQAKAQAQTNITAALKAAGIEGDVAFDIIVNAPADSIEVSALYFNNGDRAVINTVKATN